MCSYRDRKPDPTEMMQLDSFTVDYCESIPGDTTFCCCCCCFHLNDIKFVTLHVERDRIGPPR